MTNNQSDGGNWFEDDLIKLYNSLFDPGSSIYVPKIITDGYDDDKLGIHIQPRNSVSVSDITHKDVGQALPGGCGLDFTNGDATFNGLNNVITNLSAVSQGGPLVFTEQDSVIQLPLSFSSIILNGDLLAIQPCQDINNNNYTKTWTGKYTVTASELSVTATITLSLGTVITAVVHPITVTQPTIAITGTVENPPPNLENWWVELANSPQVVGQIQAAITEGLASSESERWIESVINPLLAQIPI